MHSIAIVARADQEGLGGQSAVVFLVTSRRHHEIRPVSLINVSLINDAQIVERILQHVGLWVDEVYNHGVRIAPSTGQPEAASVEGAESIKCG